MKKKTNRPLRLGDYVVDKTDAGSIMYIYHISSNNDLALECVLGDEEGNSWDMCDSFNYRHVTEKDIQRIFTRRMREVEKQYKETIKEINKEVSKLRKHIAKVS